MAYLNGRIPYSAMTALSTGGHMLAAAAAAFEAWRIQAARAGFDLRPTSASDTFRPYEVQERIFRDRYRAGNLAGRAGFTRDVRYWNGQPWTRRSGTAAAAVPGTSNHGKALAVDIKNAGAFGGPFHAWMSRTGPALGWSNTEGRSVNEPWHWVHSGARLVDNHSSGGGSVTVPNVPGAPAPLTPEDFLSELSPQEQRNLYDRVMGALPGANNGRGQFARVLDPGDGNALLEAIRAAAPNRDAERKVSEMYDRVNFANRPDGTPYKIAVQGDIDAVLRAIAGVKPGTAQVDTAHLAEVLKTTLGAAVAAELSNRLKG